MRIHVVLLASVLVAACSAPPRKDEGVGFQSFGASTFVDTDGDGLPDARLPQQPPPGDWFIDTNGDGLPDLRVPIDAEWYVDSDGDGLPDRRVPTPLPTLAPAR